MLGWAIRALLESLFHDKKIVTDDFVLQAFTDHVHNNDGYTIQRSLAGFSTPQFEDAKLASLHAPTLVLWGGQDGLIRSPAAKSSTTVLPGRSL
jgi:pimeloyl-ACP methyl ester carboxylesterase